MKEAISSRPEITSALVRGARRHLRDLGYSVLTEVTFANGRRADLFALGAKGDLLVCEVKSGLDDFRVDVKWPDYRDYCDALFFVVEASFPLDILPPDVGIIVADGFGGALLRDAPKHALSGPRRKALTLAFAKLAESRLAAFDDPTAALRI